MERDASAASRDHCTHTTSRAPTDSRLTDGTRVELLHGDDSRATVREGGRTVTVPRSALVPLPKHCLVSLRSHLCGVQQA